MAISDIWLVLEQLPWAVKIREGAYYFPVIECVHVLAISLVVGTIMIVDLRLLGLPNREKAVRRLVAEVLPYTWTFFVLAAISGGLMFISRAITYAAAVPFQLKFACLFLAGFNMLVFHLFQYRSVDLWDRLTHPPISAKIAGAVSLCLWLSIIVFGRWVGFVII